MRSRRLAALVKRLHKRDQGTDLRFRRELEGELVQRHAELWGARESARRQAYWMRPIPLALGVLVLLVGGAWIPVDVPVDLGQLITFEVPSGLAPGLAPSELARQLDEKHVADSVSVSISKNEDRTWLRLILFGEQTDPVAAIRELTDLVPALSESQYATRALQGNVRSTLGALIGHDWLAIDVRFTDPEAARSKVLEFLLAKGFKDASVDIRQGPNRREITIDLN